MSHGIYQDTPPDEGSVVGTRLLRSILKQMPSSQLKLGDRELEQAHEITHEFRSVISQGDRNVISERITFAQEVKARVELKRGFSRFRHAREFRMAARGACQYAERASSRVGDKADFYRLPDTLSTSSGEFISSRVMSVARPLYRCYLSCQDAFPSHAMMDDWLTYVWFEACARADVDPSSLALPHADELLISNIKHVTDLKVKITSLVESLYGFNACRAPDHNAGRAKALLTNMTFVYREPNFGRTPHDQYRHPIIQKVVNMMWFQNKDSDGVVFHEHFTPIPIQVLALVLTAIECCINEWIDGIYRVSDWNESRYSGVYNSHISSLSDLRGHGPQYPGGDLLEQIQREVLKNARLHAGVSSEPVTGSGRLDADALDVAILGNPPRYFGDGSPIPGITISPPGA